MIMNETGSLVTSKPFKNVLNFPPLWTPTKGPFLIQTINFWIFTQTQEIQENFRLSLFGEKMELFHSVLSPIRCLYLIYKTKF